MSHAGIVTESTIIGNDIKTVTGEVGGAVAADLAGNINLLGNGPQGLLFTGTPGTNTINGNISDASTIQKGVSELATDGETQLLADTTRTITPSNMSALFAVEKQSGFAAFTGAGSIYTVVGTTFTLDRPGYGWINTKLVTWAGGQSTAALAAGSTYYIYINSAGIIGATATRSTALFQDNIVLYQMLVDSGGVAAVIVVKENHMLDTHPSTMNALHALGVHGYWTVGATGGTIAINGAAGIQINGTTYWQDHDLMTQIPDSAAAAINFHVMYTNVGGKWVRYALQNTLPSRYNNAGVTAALAASQHAVYDLLVSKDDIESTTPKYIAVMSGVYANLAAARTAVTNTTFPTATNELAEIELIRMGVAIVSTAGIVEITVKKQTIGTGTITSVGTAASLISLDTTSFDGYFSSLTTTAQVAFQAVDDLYHSLTTQQLSIAGIAAGYTDSSEIFQQGGVQTADAVATQIAAIVLAANTMVTVEARFGGFRDDYSSSCGGFLRYTARRAGAGAIEVAAPIVDVQTDSAGAPTVDADVSGNNVRLLVTGVAAQTWNWVVSYHYHFTKTNA